MHRLHELLQARFRRWSGGYLARLPRPIAGALGRWLRLDRVEAFVAAHGQSHGFDFVRAALGFLGLRYQVEEAGLARIPGSGPVLVVANHPSGGTDALALLDVLGRVRRDVRVVANDFLGALEGLQSLLLPVRILGGTPGPGSVRAVGQALADGHCVVVFPAGEVARLGWRGVREGRWRRGFVQFARRSGAPVVPVGIRARNSLLFYIASALCRPAGTALLLREIGRLRELTFRAIGEGTGRSLDLDAYDGDWVESLTALVEDPDGSLHLLTHAGEVLATLSGRPAPALAVPQAA